MKATQIFESNIVKIIGAHIKHQEEGLFYFVADRTTAFPGFGNAIDKELCENLNIGVITLPNEGGIIVSSKGSISVGYFTKNLQSTFNEILTERIVEELLAKGLDIILDGNDILVDDNYKIASSGTRRFKDILFCTFHISYDVDLDAIRQICTKPMVKTPKGFKDYGFSEEDLLNIFLKHAEEYTEEVEIEEEVETVEAVSEET